MEKDSYIHLLFWLVMFGLPWLPLIGYLPLAMLVAALGLSLIVSLKKSANELRLYSLGGMILAASVILSLLVLMLRRDYSAWSINSAYFLLAILTLIYTTSKHRVRENHILQILTLLSLTALALWTARYAITSNYAELTALLSYTHGPGNISQIAIFASFALILLHFYSANKAWFLFAALALAVPLTYWLDSKLLGGVAILVLMGHFLRGQPLRRQRIVAGAMLIVGLAGVLIVQPDSLAGRLRTSELIWSNFDWSRPLGMGIGHLDELLNGLFATGKAVNDIGEIGPIAFNDYSQVLAELGLPGLLGLLVISAGVLLGRRPMGGLAWILVTAIMFPLEYVESAVLWGATAGLLTQGGPEWKLKWSLRPFHLGITGIALLLTLYFTYTYACWYHADQENDLVEYENLEPFFSWNDEFHRIYGLKIAESSPAKAIPQLELAAALNPSYLNLAALADAYFDLPQRSPTQYENALKQYEIAARVRPKKLYPRYRKVYGLISLNRTAEAQLLISELQTEYSGTGNPAVMAMLTELNGLELEVE